MTLQEAEVLVRLASELWQSYLPTEEAAVVHADLLSDDDVTFDEARVALRELAKLKRSGREFYLGPGGLHRAVMCTREGLPVDASDDDRDAEEQQRWYRAQNEHNREHTARWWPNGIGGPMGTGELWPGELAGEPRPAALPAADLG